jgi:hypothetical protein
MATFLGVIVDTGERADFWSLARAQRVEPLTNLVPPHALITCWEPGERGWPPFAAPPRLARELSHALSRRSISLVAQTVTSVIDVREFDRGVEVRVLQHIDPAGWVRTEGEPEPWESAVLFASPPALDEDLPEEDIERYEQARIADDPSRALDLILPDHLGPILRLCDHFGLSPQEPTARWRKRSLLARIFALR